MEYNTLRVVFRTIRCRLFGKTDIERWHDTQAFDDDWVERTQLIAEFIPKGTRVIEFGAGKRQLETMLDSNCTYIPSDVVDRGPNTLVVDLNVRPLPNLTNLNLQTAVFAGVLEYICDLNSLVSWLARQVTTCIVSYECSQTRPKSLARLKETIMRTGAGWVNTLTEDELVDQFRFGGFVLMNKQDWYTVDGNERIFVFGRQLRTPQFDS